MIKAHELPEPKDGRNPVPARVQFQLRRINRIATALFELRTVIGEHPDIRINLDPSSDFVQVSLAVDAPADRAVAEGLVTRLQWDREPSVRRSGMNRILYWHGMIGGFRGDVSWVERPEAVDTQGREALPAGVGVGDRAADAAHVGPAKLTPIASVLAPTVVPPMHADLQRLGCEL